MKNQNSIEKRWYDNKALLIVLFFVFPPLGIYAMSKHKTLTWKKIVYIVPASLLTLFILLGIMGGIMMDNYKVGISYYNSKEYLDAYESFKNVDSKNVNYQEAKNKMKELKPIVDSIYSSQKQDRLSKRKLKEEKKLKKLKQKELEENPEIAYPKPQQCFLTILRETKQEYKEASNELKKSVVRTNRGERLKKCIGNKRVFTDWIGIVSDMRTTSKGNAVFEIKIEGTKIKIGTMNNELSDAFEGTLISQENSLYRIISELKEGDKVIISGSFIPSDRNDYIYEISLTESGSMQSPGFVAEFSKVSK